MKKSKEKVRMKYFSHQNAAKMSQESENSQEKVKVKIFLSPECSKNEPRKQEGRSKAEKSVTPGEVKHRGKEVFQVSEKSKMMDIRKHKKDT